MEKFSYRGRAKEKIWETFENCRAFKEMAEAAASRASELQLPRAQFEDQLYKLYDAYGAFLNGTNRGFDQAKWRHWYNHYRYARLGKQWGEPYLSHLMLSAAAWIYLHGALRVPRMDRALVDALIAQKTFAFIDQRGGRGAVMTQFGCFVFPVAVAIVWQLLFGAVNWHRLSIGVGIVTAGSALLFLWPRKGVLQRYGAMRETYHLLTGSVVSVSDLRCSIERARESGVAWPPELYAVLDDVEARTRTL